MDNTTNLNDAPIVQQSEGMYQRYLMFVLMKLVGDQQVIITIDDMKAYEEKYGPEGAVLFLHGMPDAIAMSLVDHKRAREIAAHQKTLESKGAH
jgi:hypothetical protein